MHLEFERSGGFAGLTVRAVLEAVELTAAETAGIAALPRSGRAARRAGARDVFTYQVTLVDGHHRQVHRFSDLDIGDAARPLLERLARAAEPPRRPGL